MRRWLHGLGAIALIGAIPVALNQAEAADTFNCSANFQIDRVMENGARWQMCWERRNNEGIVLHDVTYTPDGGQPVEVLGRASLAEIHVPYDDNGARFHDLSDYGLGVNLDGYVAADCPDGTLLDGGGASDIVCQTELPIGYGIKYYNTVGQATTLNLHSTSCIGEYCYTVAWNFDDDGTLRPEVGAEGQLQRLNGPQGAGWPVGNGNSRFAVAHMHNFYWRLDFDIDGTPANDRVEELEARPVSGSQRERFNNTRLAFTQEVARKVAPGAFRSWRVRDLTATNGDNHPISWELLPNTDHVFRGPNFEPFTHNDLYVTRHNACERFATHNPGACADDVSGYVNNQSLNGDLVVWYGSSFHHLPRDEDEDHMHPHWTGFSIIPRDLTAENPEP